MVNHTWYFNFKQLFKEYYSIFKFEKHIIHDFILEVNIKNADDDIVCSLISDLLLNEFEFDYCVDKLLIFRKD